MDSRTIENEGHEKGRLAAKKHKKRKNSPERFRDCDSCLMAAIPFGPFSRLGCFPASQARSHRFGERPTYMCSLWSKLRFGQARLPLFPGYFRVLPRISALPAVTSGAKRPGKSKVGFLPHFPLEPTAVQSIATQIGLSQRRAKSCQKIILRMQIKC
jgi:hypothetical protein